MSLPADLAPRQQMGNHFLQELFIRHPSRQKPGQRLQTQVSFFHVPFPPWDYETPPNRTLYKYRLPQGDIA
jgi:hypothetical protein